MPESNRLDRRHFIAGTGSAMASSLAGCDTVVIRREGAADTERSTSVNTDGESSTPTPDATSVVEEGLTGYWPLETTENGTTPDESGNGHTGVVRGNPQQIGAPVGRGLEFDGEDDFVKVDMTSELQTQGSFTMALWLRTTETTDSSTPLGMYTYDGSGRGEGQYVTTTATTVQFNVRHSDGFGSGSNDFQSNPYYRILDEPPTIAPNQWTHVVLVYDQDAPQLAFFVNGDRVFADRAPHEPRVDDTYLTIGARPAPDGGSHSEQVAVGHFEGSIDDVRVYERALTASEVRTLVERG